ncbi:MAG: xylulokinase [Eubacteriales bacterium]|nr:xylulokinase [Eubacteriales bacterium]
MKYILGIDIGTSGTKTVLFNEEGQKVCSKTIEYDLIQPKNGWAEQAPEQWLNAVKETIKYIVKNANVNIENIKGIGLSGQMHGLVMVDKNGDVLRNAILWCDGRTSKECLEITEKVGKDRLIEICANPALTGFTAGKILWIRKNEPHIYKKCYKILLPKDYIRYKLTGLFGTEPSDASGTNLFDIKNICWSKEILDKLDIDISLLPDIKQSIDIAGNLTEEISKELGLSKDTIVCMGAGDNAASAIGTGIIENGKAFTTIGTSGVIFAYTDKLIIDKECRVHTFCHAIPNVWGVMSCTLSAGMSLKWFKNNFCSQDTYETINECIKNIPIGSENLIYLPYLMGERSPILDENARGVFFGLSAIHNKYHIAKAIMEGVSYSQKQCLDLIKDMGLEIDNMYICGGGAKSYNWHKMISDIYNLETISIENEQGAVLGACILASVACGIYKNIKEACNKLINIKDKVSPTKENNNQYMKFYEIYKNLYPALKDGFKQLNSIN